MKTSTLKPWVPAVAGSALLLASFSSQAALVARDLDGDISTTEAYYDDVLNITWLADASLAKSQTFGLSVGNSGNQQITTTGNLRFDAIDDYFTAMNAANGGLGYLDVSNWRSVNAGPVNGSSFQTHTRGENGEYDFGFNISAEGSASEGFLGNELAYHFYNNLGGEACINPSGCRLEDMSFNQNADLFENIQAMYWGDDSTIDIDGLLALCFNFTNGMQETVLQNDGWFLSLWVVADGDVGTSTATVVPVPATAWLFGSALIVLGRLTRRNSGSACPSTTVKQ